MASTSNTTICAAYIKKTGLKCNCKAKRGFLYCGRHIHYTQQNPDVVVPENTECPICIETITRHFTVTNCGHYYHTNCLETWKRTSNRCPCCRTIMTRTTHHQRPVAAATSTVVPDWVRRYNIHHVRAILNACEPASYDQGYYTYLYEQLLKYTNR